MPAKDAFHEVVKIALQKDGWQITHDPYTLQAGTLELYIDLGAEKVVAAEKDGQKIAVGNQKLYWLIQNIPILHSFMTIH